MLTKQNVLQKSANLYLPVISSATSEVPGIRPEIISISKSDTTIIGSILCNSLSDPQFCGYSFLTNNRHAKRADGENF